MSAKQVLAATTMAGECSHINSYTRTGCQFDVPEDEIFPSGVSKQWCLFHLPWDQNRRTHGDAKQNWDEAQKESFNEKIFALVDHACAESEPLDLSGVVFPGPISFAAYKDANPFPVLALSDAIFYEEVDFSGLIFGGLVDFRNVNFRADALFRSTTFRDSAYFGSSEFNGKLDFSQDRNHNKTTFHGEANFAEMSISKTPVTDPYSIRIDFSSTIFKNTADFRSVIFPTAVSFKGCVFEGKEITNFNGAHFKLLANFEMTKFQCPETRFIDSKFDKLGNFDNSEFSGALLFQGTPPLKLSFLKSKFHTVADFSARPFLEGTSFVDAKFEGPPKFFGCKFHEGIDLSRTKFTYKGIDARLAYMQLRHVMAARRDHVQEGFFSHWRSAVSVKDCTHILWTFGYLFCMIGRLNTAAI